MTQSIDDIWAEMQQDAAPAKQPPTRSKVTVHRDIAPKRAPDEPTPIRSLAELPEPHILQRYVNTMGDKDGSRGDRLAAVTQVHSAFKLVVNPAAPRESDASVLFETCSKPLIKRLYDKAERVRVAAAEALTECWALPGPALGQLAYLTPVLIDRLIKAEQFEWEPSEEARVALAGLLKAALTTNARGVMGAHSQEVLFVLINGFKDPHPEVKLIMLSCVQLVTPTVMHYSVWKEEHKALTAGVQPVLAHRHAKVRLAGLEALDSLVQLGGAAEYIQTVCGDQIKPKMWGDIYPETLPENRGKKIEDVQKEAVKHNFFAMMIHDGNNAVRRRFYEMLGNWLSVVEDKMDHEHQLAPYLLSGLSDNAAEVRRSTLQMLDRVGERYELDNELDFKETLEYGQVRYETARWNKFFSGKLPDPFMCRPRLGARIFVKSHAYRMLPACVRELKETLFTETVRLRSAVLIRNILVLLEDHSIKFARSLLEAWVNACHECPDDSKLIACVLESAGILVHFVGMESFNEFMAPGTQLYDKHPAAATLILSALLQGSEHPYNHTADIWQLFIQSAAAESRDHRMRTALVQLMMVMLDSLDASALDPRELAHSVCELMAANEEAAQSVSVEIPAQLQHLVEEHVGWLLDKVTECFNDGRYSFSFCSRHRQVLRKLLLSAQGNEPCLVELGDTLEGGVSSTNHEVMQETVECALVLTAKPVDSPAFLLAANVLTELVANDQIRVETAELAIRCLECVAGESEVSSACAGMVEQLQHNCQTALEFEHGVLAIRQRAAALARGKRPAWAVLWWPTIIDPLEEVSRDTNNESIVIAKPVVKEEKKRKTKIRIEEVEEKEEEIEEIMTEGARQQIDEEKAAMHLCDDDDSDDDLDESEVVAPSDVAVILEEMD